MRNAAAAKNIAAIYNNQASLQAAKLANTYAQLAQYLNVDPVKGSVEQQKKTAEDVLKIAAACAAWQISSNKKRLSPINQ